MLIEIFDIIKDSLAVILVGIVIKLTDDYLDKTADEKIGYYSFAHSMKEGLLAYALLFFSFAIMLNKDITLSLFFGSYIVGMFGDMKRAQGFKLKGYQESIIVAIISFAILGWFYTCLGLIAITTIQLIDDYFDLKEDYLVGNQNLVYRLGYIEAMILFLILTITLIYFSIYYTFIIFAAYSLLSRFFSKGGKASL